MEIIQPNNNYLLYYTKYHQCEEAYDINNSEFESIEVNNVEKDNNKNALSGRWSQREHLLFVKGCLIYGNFWKKVKKYIKTRSCSQIRSHAQKYLYKLNKKYFLKDNQNNINLIFGKKLSEEEKIRLANKNKFNEKDFEDAELYILYLFRGNKDRYRNKKFFMENIDNNFRRKKKKRKIISKEKIFDIKKKEKEKNKKIKTTENNKKEDYMKYLNELNGNIKDEDHLK